MTEDDAIRMVDRAVELTCAKWGRHAEDLAQEVRLQLVKAYRERFDPTKSQWTTYAMVRIHRMVIDAARSLGIVERKRRKQDEKDKPRPSVVTLSATANENGNELDPIDPEDDQLGLEYEDLLQVLDSDQQLRSIARYLRFGTMKRAGASLGLSVSRISQWITEIRLDPSLRQRFFALAGIPLDQDVNPERSFEMLILTRKKDETVKIDGPSVITVARVRGSFVQLGIEADRSTLVLRGELEGTPKERKISDHVRLPLRIAGHATGRRILETTLDDGRRAEAFVGDDRELYVSIDGDPMRAIALVDLVERVAKCA